MTSITQDMRYRLSLLQYAQKHGVSKAAMKYKTNRQYITITNQHTPEEIKLIMNMRRRNP